MALPEAVQKIGDAAEAQAVELGLKGGDKPVSVAPATTTEPVKTEQQKIDPENYKERYSRYKATTDATITELRQTLADIQATLTETQRQNQELIQKLNAAPTVVTAVPEVTAGPKNDDAAYEAWLNKLPQKIRDEYTEDYLRDQFTIQTTAVGRQDNASPDNLKELEQKIGHLEQVQVKTERQLYLETMDKAYPDDKWIEMTHSEGWSEFCSKTVSPADQRSYGQIVEQGDKGNIASIVIWALSEYQKHLSDLNGSDTTDAPNGSLETLITPEGGAGGDPVQEINAQTETYTVSQVNQFYQDKTKGKYSDEEFKAIEKSILRAQDAGKIIQG